jgi:hypothetical protein
MAVETPFLLLLQLRDAGLGCFKYLFSTFKFLSDGSAVSHGGVSFLLQLHDAGVSGLHDV